MVCVRKPRGQGPFLLVDLYNRLLDAYGPQGWWPSDGPFETIVGAVLTQNTAWSNVEKAIVSLKKEGLMTPAAIVEADQGVLRAAVKPAGYFNQKADRLRGISVWIMEEWGGDAAAMLTQPTLKLRQNLLAQKGIGPETADSIMLYAGGKPVFVIDAYTIRIIGRVGLSRETEYRSLQNFFLRNLPLDVALYKEYHALLVRLGKTSCRKDIARAGCRECPVGRYCETSLRP
jgi:endonuclease-3 related protein